MNTPHSQAFALARRLSVKNEPDLLQEDVLESPPGSPYSQRACFNLLSKLAYHQDGSTSLPRECQELSEIQVALERRNSKKSAHAIAFQGMSPHEAAAAMAARERGSLHHAQIQRRLTSDRKTLW